MAVSLGLTSAFSGQFSCGSDPAICVTDPGISKGFFNLAAGPHSITINHVQGKSGEAYFRVDNSNVPEPSSILLLCGGLLGLGLAARRRLLA